MSCIPPISHSIKTTVRWSESHRLSCDCNACLQLVLKKVMCWKQKKLASARIRLDHLKNNRICEVYAACSGQYRVACVSFTWVGDCIRIHYGKKRSWRKKFNVLLGTGPAIHVDINLTFATFANIVAEMQTKCTHPLVMAVSVASFPATLQKLFRRLWRISFWAGVCGMWWNINPIVGHSSSLQDLKDLELMSSFLILQDTLHSSCLN